MDGLDDVCPTRQRLGYDPPEHVFEEVRNDENTEWIMVCPWCRHPKPLVLIG